VAYYPPFDAVIHRVRAHVTVAPPTADLVGNMLINGLVIATFTIHVGKNRSEFVRTKVRSHWGLTDALQIQLTAVGGGKGLTVDIQFGQYREVQT
jgi:hypothetical protein